jgi:spore germination protein GerM
MRRNLILIAIVIPILLFGGLYLRNLFRRTFFENRQRPEAEMKTQLQQQELQSEANTQASITLFFPDYDTGRLVEEGQEMALAPNNVDRIRQIVLALVAGSQQGHASALPPGTLLRAVFLTSDGTAYLDFSDDIRQNLPVGIESEALAVYSVVDSLATNIPAVKRVKFLIEGQDAETLDGHIDLTGIYTPDLTWAGGPAEGLANSAN